MRKFQKPHAVLLVFDSLEVGRRLELHFHARVAVLQDELVGCLVVFLSFLLDLDPLVACSFIVFLSGVSKLYPPGGIWGCLETPSS